MTLGAGVGSGGGRPRGRGISGLSTVSPLRPACAPPRSTERGLEGLPGCPLRSAVPMSGADPPSPHPQLVNRHVYSGSADRTVKCWLADTGERVRTFAAHRHSVSALKYHAGTCK